MAKRNNVIVQQLASSSRRMPSFIDSSTHRLIPSVGGKTFVLKKEDVHIPVYVKLKKQALHNGSAKSALKKRRGKYELTIPVQQGKASVITSPITIVYNGKKYLLAAATGSTTGIIGSQRVSLSLFSENEQ